MGDLREVVQSRQALWGADGENAAGEIVREDCACEGCH